MPVRIGTPDNKEQTAEPLNHEFTPRQFAAFLIIAPGVSRLSTREAEEKKKTRDTHVWEVRGERA